MKFDKNVTFAEFLNISTEISKIQGTLDQTNAYMSLYPIFFEKVWKEGFTEGFNEGYNKGVKEKVDNIIKRN